MARRRRTGPADDFMSVVALLPWWACIALAVVSYLVLHRLAQPVAVAPLPPGQLPGAIIRSAMVGVANAAQYFVPILCLGAAIVSALGGRKRRNLLGDVAQSKSADALHRMSWQDFEELVGESFRLQGYAVTETGGGGADGGVDLILRKGSEKFLVQCKQWRAFSVGVQPVRELYGLMAATGATGGFVVSSGRFTEDAMAFAEGRNVALIDGPKLRGLIEQAKASLATKGSSAVPVKWPAVRSSSPPVQRLETIPPGAPMTDPVPTCPVCSRRMVLRTAHRGANAGRAFWGCAGYPGCNGTRPTVRDRPAPTQENPS